MTEIEKKQADVIEKLMADKAELKTKLASVHGKKDAGIDLSSAPTARKQPADVGAKKLYFRKTRSITKILCALPVLDSVVISTDTLRIAELKSEGFFEVTEKETNNLQK